MVREPMHQSSALASKDQISQNWKAKLRDNESLTSLTNLAL
jgi:hypothetical protein